MTPTESLAILRKAAAYDRRLKAAIDDDVRHAWIEALTPHRFADATQAVAAIGRTPTAPGTWLRIETGDIIREIRHIRAQRITDGESHLTNPPANPTDYLDWLHAARKALADGATPQQASITARHPNALDAPPQPQNRPQEPRTAHTGTSTPTTLSQALTDAHRAR